MSDVTEIDVAIVGGGIAGLMIGHEITRRFPNLHTFIFEKEKYLGDHTTGRNSGVLHSGLYYPQGSLKHQLCLEGNNLWEILGRDLHVKVQKCGKFIFCSNLSELEGLEQLKAQADKNSVPAVRWATSSEKQKLAAYANIHDTIFVPSTGFIDVTAALNALEREILNHGGHVLKSNSVQGITKVSDTFLLETRDGTIASKILINAAGLWSTSLGKQIWSNGLEDYFVKGSYLKYSGDFFRESFIYPCPLKNLKGLGVHSTFDVSGAIKFGPNVEDVSKVDYSLNLSLLDEMKKEIARYYPQVDVTKLSPDYCGIRSKIRSKGQLYPDFWIKGPHDTQIPGYVEICGYESPGLTAAPAMARLVVKLLGI